MSSAFFGPGPPLRRLGASPVGGGPLVQLREGCGEGLRHGRGEGLGRGRGPTGFSTKTLGFASILPSFYMVLGGFTCFFDGFAPVFHGFTTGIRM